jgi:hypothetical protein
MSQFDWLITQKNMKLWRLPKIERFYFEVQSSSPLAPTYAGGKRRRNLHGIKVRCYGEHIFGNLGGGGWKHIGNLIGTHWEPK